MMANESTTLCILSVDVVGNLYECYVIKKLQRKIGLDELEQKKRNEENERNIRNLAVSEVVEIIIPLVYTVTYSIAYYGPNQLILNNMRLDLSFLYVFMSGEMSPFPRNDKFRVF